MNTSQLLDLMLLRSMRGRGGHPGTMRGGTQGRGGDGVAMEQPPIAQRFLNRGAGAAPADFNREQLAIQLAQQQQNANRQQDLDKIALSGAMDRATQADRLVAADHNLRNELKFRGMDADADRRLRAYLTQADQQFRGEQAGLERQHDVSMLQQQYGLMQQRDELGFYQQREQENAQWMATMAQQKGLMNSEASARWDTTRRQLAKVEEIRSQLSPGEYYQARSQVFDEARRYDWQNNMDDPIKKIGVFDYFTHPDGKGGTQYMKIGVSGKATPEELQQWGQNQFIQVPGVGWMTLSPDGGNSTFYPESKLGQQTGFDFEKMYEMGMKVLSRQVKDPDKPYDPPTTMLPTREEVMEWMQYAREAQERISRGQPLWTAEDYDRASLSRLRNTYRDQYGPAKAEWDNNRNQYRQRFGIDMGDYPYPNPNEATPQQLQEWAPQLGYPQFKRNPIAPGVDPTAAPPAGDTESHTLGRMSVQGPEANRMSSPAGRQGPATLPGDAGYDWRFAPPAGRQGPATLPAVPGGRQPSLNVPTNVPLDEEGRPLVPRASRGPASPPVTMPDAAAARRVRDAAAVQNVMSNPGYRSVARAAQGPVAAPPPRMSAAETQDLPVMTDEEAEARSVTKFITPDGRIRELVQ